MENQFDEVRIIDLPDIPDSRGHLTVIDNGSIPFTPKRVFYIHDVPENTSRGGHAHKTNCQFLICICGSFKLRLAAGEKDYLYQMNDPAKGVLVPPLTWTDMSDFTPGTILLVLCSESYNKAGYINDFDEYLRYVSTKSR